MLKIPGWINYMININWLLFMFVLYLGHTSFQTLSIWSNISWKKSIVKNIERN